MVRRLAAAALVVFAVGCASNKVAPEVERGVAGVRSPDGRIGVTLAAGEKLTYAVEVDGKSVLAPSQLGLMFRGWEAWGPGAKVVGVTRAKADRTWENPLGKRRVVRDRYNEVTVKLRQESPGARVHEFSVVVRSYDDGVALRYVLGESEEKWGTLTLDRELTQFVFANDAKCWAGSQLSGFAGPQEWEYWPTVLSALPGDRPTGLPLLAKTDAAYVAITESDLLDYAGMWVTTRDAAPGTPPVARHTAQTPRPKEAAMKQGPVALYAHLAPRFDGRGLVRMGETRRTPWRVVMIGREPGKLVESDLVTNLATPSEIDASWVKPGMMAWDHWWSGDVKMDTETLKKYIQLAADMGWPYQLVDWQWYGPFNKPESDITKVNPAIDMDEVRRFAKERNVKLWLWLYWTDVDKDLDGRPAYEKAFELYEKWGIAGVKIDFMDRDDQEIVNWYEKITKAAADHHLMINFHGAYKPTGMNRTYPNQVTREGILGNEYNRWSKRVTPEHKVTLPFTRYLAGPGDYTPGGFLNRQPAAFKADRKKAQVQGTRAAELALFVVYDSPVTCACDHPDQYAGQAGVDFLKAVPTVWDETKVIEGEVGEKIVVARRKGSEWYVGALTNSQGRDVAVKTDFLGSGKWGMRVWKDAAESGTDAEKVETEDRDVRAGEVVNLKLAPAGGAAVRFVRK